jgi:hypothetical protein
MTIGIIPGWFLIGVIANGFGGVPIDLCAAGIAIGISLSVASVSRNSNVLTTLLLPLSTLMMRYIVLPSLLRSASSESPLFEVHIAQLLASPSALIVASVLSILVSYLLGMKWVYTGEAK